MSGQQFQQHPTQQQPRYHNNNKSSAPNQNNNSHTTGSSSTTPNAASGASFEYSEPPGATTRTTPDSGLGTDDQKQANQQLQGTHPRAPPGFHQHRGHPQQNFYQGMRPTPHQAPNGIVYFNTPPQPQQQYAAQPEGYDPQFAPGYNQGGQRAYHYSENSGYVAPEDGGVANNNFVIHGPNDGFDGRPQYNQQAAQPLQQGPPPHHQAQMVAANFDGAQGYAPPPNMPAQYYAGQAVINQHAPGYQGAVPQQQYRGGPHPQMMQMMQGGPQQVYGQQPQVVYYAQMPPVVRQQPAADKNKVAKRNSQEEEQPVAPQQNAPAQQPMQPMYQPMVQYPNVTPQQFQQMQFQAFAIQHHQQQQMQMNPAYQGYPPMTPQGRPMDQMGGVPTYQMRGGFQQRGQMHPQNVQNNPMNQMGYFQAPTNGPPAQSGRGGRGRGRGNFHSRQNSGQSHYSGYNNQRQYEGNSASVEPREEQVDTLSNEVESIQLATAESGTGTPSEQEIPETVEEKPEEVIEKAAEEVEVKEVEKPEAKVEEKKDEEKKESDNHCYHCEYHEKPREEVVSHNIRKPNGELWCKDLQKQKCLHCDATGENGHHYLVCPKKKEEEKAQKEAEKKSRESSQAPALPPQEVVEEKREESNTPEPPPSSRHNSESHHGGRFHGGHHHHNDRGGYGRGRGRGGRGGGFHRGGRGHHENKRH